MSKEVLVILLCFLIVNIIGYFSYRGKKNANYFHKEHKKLGLILSIYIIIAVVISCVLIVYLFWVI